MEIPSSANANLVKLLNAVNAAAGTASGALTSAAIHRKGATSIAMASAGTGTIVAGDTVTFGGDDSKTAYKITTGDGNVGNGGTIVITPGLFTDIAAGSTITIRNTTNANAVAGAAVHDTNQGWAVRDNFLYHMVQVNNPGGALVTIYASLDAVNWTELVSTSAEDLISLPDGPYYAIKALRDATTVATVTVLLLSQSVTGNQ